MQADFEKLERDAEREYLRLARLFDAALPPERALRRTIDNVANEAKRIRLRKTILRTAAGVAAALVILAVIFYPAPEAQFSSLQSLTFDDTFNDWVSALGETDERFTALLNTDWVLDVPQRESESADTDKLMESLKESFSLFEGIIGA